MANTPGSSVPGAASSTGARPLDLGLNASMLGGPKWAQNGGFSPTSAASKHKNMFSSGYAGKIHSKIIHRHLFPYSVTSFRPMLVTLFLDSDYFSISGPEYSVQEMVRFYKPSDLPKSMGGGSVPAALLTQVSQPPVLSQPFDRLQVTF